MFTRPWRIYVYGILELLFLVTLIGCGLTGCDDILSDIKVTPSNNLKGGTTGQASIRVKDVPADAKFIWRGSGVKVSQDSERHLSVTITAPNNPGQASIPATVTFEVWQGGKILDSRTEPIYVTPGGTNVASGETARPTGEATARKEESGTRKEGSGDSAQSKSAAQPPTTRPQIHAESQERPNLTVVEKTERPTRKVADAGTKETVRVVQAPKATPPRREQPVLPPGPQVLITEVPPEGPGGPGPPSESISGKVSGVTPEECRVVVYAHTDNWYVQPYVEPTSDAPNAPFTEIESDGTWSAPTRTGSEYAALLVRRSYEPRSSISALPAVGGNILSVAKVKGR